MCILKEYLYTVSNIPQTPIESRTGSRFCYIRGPILIKKRTNIRHKLPGDDSTVHGTQIERQFPPHVPLLIPPTPQLHPSVVSIS